MKTIGLLGGMSWESTTTYYQEINRETARRLGGLHSAPLLLHSVDFAEIEALQKSGDWERAGAILNEAAKGLVGAGAQLLVLCTNTMHKVAPRLQQGIAVPFLHIAHATADALLADGAVKIGLLGTKPTMQEDFYKQALWQRGIEVLLPTPWQMDEVHRVIFEELCRGVLAEDSRAFFLALIEELARQGAQGVVLGCTEIGLLVHQQSTAIPLFDTTRIHAHQAVELALQG
ncbi:aspartate/glutamate racemase family protein [Ruminococcaceae bacterium OttesenSCG-928-O06]|nr:aspartate/glutamate racemase family protein [Ruminococcaceae bacterium OttesenSCG-928-O06]